MRTSLVLLVAGAAMAGACVLGSVRAVRAQVATSAPASSVDAETLKDVEIMRRVLVCEGLGSRSFATSWVNNGGNDVTPLTYSYSYSPSYAEAFVVPGQGATFVLRTSDPVTAPRGTDTPAET